MTWKHIAALLIAATMVVVCGVSQNCGPNISHIVQLATAIVGGAVGNAMNSAAKTHDKNVDNGK